MDQIVNDVYQVSGSELKTILKGLIAGNHTIDVVVPTCDHKNKGGDIRADYIIVYHKNEY